MVSQAEWTTVVRRLARSTLETTSWVLPSAARSTLLVSCLLDGQNHLIHTYPVLAIKNGTITLRERDSTAQLIGSIEDVIETVEHLVKGTINWQDASSKLEEYNGVQDVE